MQGQAGDRRDTNQNDLENRGASAQPTFAAGPWHTFSASAG